MFTGIFRNTKEPIFLYFSILKYRCCYPHFIALFNIIELSNLIILGFACASSMNEAENIVAVLFSVTNLLKALTTEYKLLKQQLF